MILYVFYYADLIKACKTIETKVVGYVVNGQCTCQISGYKSKGLA